MIQKIVIKIKSTLLNENNKEISLNVISSFIVKGLSVLLGLFMTPAYMRYFNDDLVLGVWFTVISIINIVLMFDLGIGNGLRNKLPAAIEKKDLNKQRELLSSAYISISILSLIVLAFLFTINNFVNWNFILNIDEGVLNPSILKLSMIILITGIVFRLMLNLNASVFFAIQKSSINNIIGLISSILLFVFVTFSKINDVGTNFLKLSLANAILTNIPLFLGTVFIFLKPFKNMWPRFKYFNIEEAKDILKIGTVLLLLQVTFMIISSTHPFLIIRFRNPEEVVEYNIYYKVYYSILSIFYLALTPIWSAVTKAQAQKDYIWILKLYKFLLSLIIPFVILNIFSILFLQKFFDLWLNEKSIIVNSNYALIFVFFNTCFAIHNVNTSIFNGLSDFKIQTIFMFLAAILMIPLSYTFAIITNSWIGIIIGSSLSIIPYQIIQIIVGIKKLKIKSKINN